jgi:hypothetical protein
MGMVGFLLVYDARKLFVFPKHICFYPVANKSNHFPNFQDFHGLHSLFNEELKNPNPLQSLDLKSLFHKLRN